MNSFKDTQAHAVELLICEMEEPLRKIKACGMLAYSLIEMISTNEKPADTGILEDASMLLFETIERNVTKIENLLYRQ